MNGHRPTPCRPMDGQDKVDKSILLLLLDNGTNEIRMLTKAVVHAESRC